MAGVWILTVTVVTSACWIQVVIGSCPTGKFGDSCFYSCHCGDSCDQTTGVCGGGCDAGWVGGYGATCQKDIFKLQTSVLSLSNSSSSIPGVTCYTFPSDTAKTDNSVYDVTCDGTGRYFTITHSTETLNLCEVEIFVCSHGTFGELCNHYCHCSDGPCDRFSGICAGDCRPGWQRQNCSTECDKDQYGVNCNETCGNRKCAAASSSCDRHTGSCDTGCLPGWTEVDCKQECSLGTYGQNCGRQCTQRNCAGNSSCDHVTGKCVTRCKPGWMGIDCVQACELHRYGPNCDKACASRHCVGNSSCYTTGHCDTGCETGWTLDDCTACDSQLYGPNCSKTCGSRPCVGSSSCNSTGDCDRGCEPGWTGADCTASLPQENNPDRGEETLIPAVTVTTIVVVVAAVAVGVVCWRRRRRPSLQESDSHEYYNTSHLSKVQTKQSRDNDETQLEDRAYDGLSVMSREIQAPGETYCTLNTETPDLEGGAAAEVAETTDRDVYEPTEPQTYETLDSTSRDVAEMTDRDIYEPTEPQTYETLDSTSRDMIGEYSALGKIA